MSTNIEWVRNPDGTKGETWNPVTGCNHAGSPGCDHCYARRMARRLAGRYGYPEAPNHFNVTPHHNRLDEPFRRKKPTTYFVCSMSDWLHPDVPFSYAALMFAVMSQNRQHTYQLLTKRATRLLPFFHWAIGGDGTPLFEWPLPNVWLGVSVENQATADERREYLRQTPAAIKFVSYEPALGPVDWTGWEFVDQIISGGESGPKARPSHPDWHRATRDFCQKHGIAYFMKQWGTWKPIDETGEKLREWVDKPDGFCWLHLKYGQPSMGGPYSDPGWQMFERVGKKYAGHLLDGREWRQFPNV